MRPLLWGQILMQPFTMESTVWHVMSFEKLFSKRTSLWDGTYSWHLMMMCRQHWFCAMDPQLNHQGHHQNLQAHCLRPTGTSTRARPHSKFTIGSCGWGKQMLMHTPQCCLQSESGMPGTSIRGVLRQHHKGTARRSTNAGRRQWTKKETVRSHQKMGQGHQDRLVAMTLVIWALAVLSQTGLPHSQILYRSLGLHMDLELYLIGGQLSLCC